MASTYSNLKIQLMTTGENNTTWGNVTNINMGTALEEAIAGTTNIAFSNANVTLTLTDTNSSQAARNMRLVLTGTATTGYNLVVPAIQKVYIVSNLTDGTITVKNATGAGIAVPTGKTMWVYNDSFNVADVVNHLSSLTLGTPLPVAQGGTGSNTASGARTALGATTVGASVFTLANPSAVTFPRFNADNTVSALDAANFRTAIGAGTSSTVGTVTSVGGTGTASGLSLSGTVTSSGNLTLSGTVNSLAAGTYAISISGNAATATTATNATNAANFVATNFSIVQSGTNLLIRYNGADIVRITSTGAIVAEGNVTGFGTA
jgi:hypothetical protein